VSLWGEIRQRRITQIVVTYLAGGWMALAVVDQFVDRDVLPSVVYSVSLILYAFGFAAALLIGWNHGERGAQKASASEIVLLALLALGGIGTSAQVVRGTLAEAALAAARADTGMDMRRIAVRYFEDATQFGELTAVSDGITEAIIDRLAEVRSLDVVSRNGVLPYRDVSIRSDSVARALAVGTLIEGSVDQRGGRLRITTRLVDGLSGADIDRASVEIAAGEFLAARDSVAEGVSRLLRSRLGEEVRLRELRSGTSSAEAWALAQTATRLLDEAEDNFDGGGDIATSREALRQADSLLAQVESIDDAWVRPVDTRAHVAYRRAWFAASAGDVETAEEQYEIGLEHARRALAMNPGDANALEQRGTLKLFAAVALSPTRDDMARLMTEAQADLEEAVRANPSLATAYAMLSFLFTGAGDNVQSVLSARRALEEDAYLRGADRIYDRLVYAQYELEQFRDASTWCEEGYRRFPDNYRFAECQLWLMAAPPGEADVDAAWGLLARLDSLVPESLRAFKQGVGQIMVAGVLRKAALADSAESVLARVDRAEDVDPQRQLLVYEAAIRATTGDQEGALTALRRWVSATPGGTLGPSGELSWWWRDLRARPEFQQFVSRDN
jgi:TolB-like protein